MKKIKCKNCRRDIFQNSWNQLFCNASCRSRYYYHNIPRTKELADKRLKKRQKEHPELFKKWYNDFLKRNPNYRQEKCNAFIKKHGGYVNYSKELTLKRLAQSVKD